MYVNLNIIFKLHAKLDVLSFISETRLARKEVQFGTIR